jgi:putative ATP-binding cassette transporter
MCSFLFINLITRVMALVVGGHFTRVSREYIILFAAIILLYAWTKRTLSLTIIGISQKLFRDLRQQILSLVLKASYRQLSDRKTQVQAAIVNDVNTLTQTSLTVIDFFTSLILSVSCLVYLATISASLFFITLGVTLLGMSVYYLNSKRNIHEFEKARGLESTFLKHFNAIINGFKEIYMAPVKGWTIYNEKIVPVSGEVYENNTRAFTGFINNQMTGQLLFYLLITSILLLFSMLLHIPADNIIRFIFTLLYLLGAVEMVMALLPGLARARVAANHLLELKTELEQAGFNSRLPDKHFLKSTFNSITVKDLQFQYSSQTDAFGIGPVDFTLNKGEVIFVYGGNGSGKTTFMYTLLGLYMPAAGEIRLNNQLVTHDNYPEYRTLFAVVFSDFYLFDELLDVAEANLVRWNDYLQLFELKGKVSLDGKQFSTTGLSTGQRKRLGLIAALLEDKPVLVMDEWAADQDPHFRKKFYTEILPVLKQEGYTIIAITHDDRYYHCADKLYKMDSGLLLLEDIAVYGNSFAS